MRANQKDSYFENSLTNQIAEALHIFKGQRFVNTHPEEIAVFAKAAYFLLTTVAGARTLGEEYVDLIYVNRRGTRLPGRLSRVAFVACYTVLPYLAAKLFRRWSARNSTDDSTEKNPQSLWKLLLASYPKLLDTLINVHVAVFYFQGSYYLLSKRLVGMRYAFGHNKDPKKLQQTGNYSALGVIILLQFALKGLLKLKLLNDDRTRSAADHDRLLDDRLRHQQNPDLVSGVAQLEHLRDHFDHQNDPHENVNIDLSDPNALPYLPDSARSCMLCLSPMNNPSAANCGHMFCWDCVVDWIRQHPECPLCRQVCLEQNLLPLK